MKLFIVVLCFCAVNKVSVGFIIPDEIPSLLSLIYSNIPTLKKGTDSRLGWGFRLGDRADFQVLVELGPQKETQPLANQGENPSSGKRHAGLSLADSLYAQRQQEKNQISDTAGGKFIDQWSKKMAQSEEEPTRIQLGLGEVDARDVIPDDSILKLEELYGRKSLIKTTTTVKPKTTTSYRDALDNVDLD